MESLGQRDRNLLWLWIHSAKVSSKSTGKKKKYVFYLVHVLTDSKESKWAKEYYLVNKKDVLENVKMDIRSNFMPTDDKRNLPAPWVHKAGPTGIQDDVISILRTESNG